MRPIDADQLIETMCSNCALLLDQKCDGKRIACYPSSIVRDAQTLDVAPVVHTEWIENEIITTGFVQKVCKKCGQPQLYLRTTNEGVFFRCFDDVNYCPNCGAKFRARKEKDNGSVRSGCEQGE